MKISRNLSKHLKIAAELLLVKIQTWTGREPFPHQPLQAYKKMLEDVQLELHDVVVVEEAGLTRRQVCVLVQYRTLLDDYLLFLSQRISPDAEKYGRALESVDQMLADWQSEQSVPGFPDPLKVDPPVTKRPDVRCAEKGSCQLKIETVSHKAESAFQGKDGQWTFGDLNTFTTIRDCTRCGRKWETRTREGEVQGTFQVKAPAGITL